MIFNINFDMNLIESENDSIRFGNKVCQLLILIHYLTMEIFIQFENCNMTITDLWNHYLSSQGKEPSLTTLVHHRISPTKMTATSSTNTPVDRVEVRNFH
jgi:hypothetical protein